MNSDQSETRGRQAYSNHKENICNVFDLTAKSFDTSKCYPLRIHPKAFICVHNDSEDEYVSKNLRIYGIWEQEAVALFQQALIRDPTLDVIDIGANLGLYSIIAAAMGRDVIAVEPLKGDQQRNLSMHRKVVRIILGNSYTNKNHKQI